MKTSQIGYFLALCEDLNFTKAAERCGVAQSTLTRAIKLLEREFGGPLLRRERANTHLTELGRMIRPYLLEVKKHTDNAKQRARDLKNLQRLKLMIGVMCTVAPVRLKDLIASVGAHQPPLELEVFDSTAHELGKRLEQGRLEIAIYCRPDHQSSRLHYVPLFRERMMAVVSQQHRLSKRPFVRFKELENERYLKRVNCEFDESRAWEQNGVSWKATHWSEREDWILEMCAAGIGFGFLPEYSINHPRVVALKIVEPEFWREVNIVAVRGREHSPAVGAFLRIARSISWSEQGAAPMTEGADLSEAADPTRIISNDD